MIRHVVALSIADAYGRLQNEQGGGKAGSFCGLRGAALTTV
jgi:hypothetical protein